MITHLMNRESVEHGNMVENPLCFGRISREHMSYVYYVCIYIYVYTYINVYIVSNVWCL